MKGKKTMQTEEWAIIGNVKLGERLTLVLRDFNGHDLIVKTFERYDGFSIVWSKTTLIGWEKISSASLNFGSHSEEFDREFAEFENLLTFILGRIRQIPEIKNANFASGGVFDSDVRIFKENMKTDDLVSLI
jgi:hypothetical protein